MVCTRAARQDDPPLYTRALAAKDCDLFLSLHSNAAGKQGLRKRGLSVVFYPVSGKGIGLAAELAGASIRRWERCSPRRRARPLEQRTQRRLLRGHPLHGSLRRDGDDPGHSFHTNTRMTSWLLDDENLKRLAAAGAAAIAEHYGLKKTADEPQRAETVCYHLLSDVPQGDYRTVLDKLIAADILRGRSGTGEGGCWT